MADLTWDQIESGGPTPQPTSKPATKPELTWDQIDAPEVKTASEKAHEAATKLPLKKPMTQEETTAAGLKGLKKFGKDVIDVADMVLTMPAFAGGIGVQAGAYVKGALQGRDHRDVSSVAQYAKQNYMEQAEKIGFANPLKRILGVAGLSDKLEEGHVEHALGALQTYIDKGGEYVEKQSGGKVNRDDVRYLADVVQTFAGAKIGDAAAAGGKKLGQFLRKNKPVPEADMQAGAPKPSTTRDILAEYAKTADGEKHPVSEKSAENVIKGYIKADKDIEASKAEPPVQHTAPEVSEEPGTSAPPATAEPVPEAAPTATEPIPETRAPYTDITQQAVEAGKADIQARSMESTQAAQEAAARIPAKDGIKLEFDETGGIREVAPQSTVLPKESTLESATKKVSEGRQFDMTPEERIAWNHGPKPKLESGKVDQELLAKLGLIGGGALAGRLISEDEPTEGAVLGALAGGALRRMPSYVKALREMPKSTLTKTATVAGVTGGLAAIDKDHPVEGAMLGALWGYSRNLPKASIPKIGDMTIDDFVNARNGAHEAQMREVANVANAIRKTLPDPVRREKVAKALDKGDLTGLTADELKVAKAYRGFTNDFAKAAQDTGLLKDLVENYVTHIVERKGLPQTKVQETMEAVFGVPQGQGGLNPNSRFTRQRKYQTFEELQKALENTDLEIKTMDLADITEIYGKAMSKAIENKKLITNLEQFKVGDNKLITKADEAPRDYVAVRSPQLQGLMVHPDIAPSLRFVMENVDNGPIVQGALALSMASKRLVTSVSFFHVQNLVNAYLGAMGLKGAKDVVQSAGNLTPIEQLRGHSGIDAALKAYRDGGNGDAVDTLIRNGLKAAAPIEADMNTMRKVGEMLDHGVERTTGVKTKIGEKSLGGVEALQKEYFDKVTWDYMHQGMKLAVSLREFERLTLKHPEMPKDEVARQVASYTNDTFGGLDWYRVATETQSHFGRKIAMDLLNPRGQRNLQLLMFAPDWTFSTFRSLYKALPGNDSMPLTQQLHTRYVMRTALIWATIMNGYNMMTSGHPIWENDDPTLIEYEDGSKQQVAKHAMEGPEWLIKPRQMALNKLGYIPKEIATQLTGDEYLSVKGAPKMKSRAGHVVKGLTPIAGTAIKDAEDLPDAAVKAVQGIIGIQIRPPKGEKKD